MERVAYCDSLTAMLKHLRALEGLTPPTPNRGDQTMTEHPGFVAYGAKDDEPAKPVRLTMKSGSFGNVTVHAVDANGNDIGGGHIVSFNRDGTLYLYSGILGGLVQLDDKSRIKLSSSC